MMTSRIDAVATPLYWLGFTAGFLTCTVIAAALSPLIARVVTRRRRRRLRAIATDTRRILGGIRQERPRNMSQIRRDPPNHPQAETPLIGGGVVAGRTGRHAQPRARRQMALVWILAGFFWSVAHTWGSRFGYVLDDLWIGLAGDPTTMYRPKRQYA